MVTVGIPFHNAKQALSSAIRSVFAQTYANWELILIDDGSTDESLSIARSVNDPRVKVVSDGANKGLSCRLNQITWMANGEYLARMDADDIMHPQRLATQVGFLDAHSHVDAVGSPACVIDENNHPTGVRSPGPLDLRPAAVLRDGLFVHPTITGRTEWFRTNLYDETFLGAEDRDLWLRVFEACSLAKISDPLLFYRENSRTPSQFIRQFVKTARFERRILRLHSRVDRAAAAVLIARSYLKCGLCRAGALIGLTKYLIGKRSRRLTQMQTDEALAALDIIKRTVVPGLPNASRNSRLRLCRVVTVPLTFTTLLQSQLETISDNGIECTLVSSPGEDLDLISRKLSLPCQAIEMSRNIAVFRDIGSLLRLYRLFRSERFDIVHSSTAKAGFLAAAASWLARTPIRIHTFTGQRWIELHGLRRWAVRSCDRIIARLSTHCYADSESQREFLINEGMVKPSKISVLASGSISGVDLDRFAPDFRKAASARHRMCIEPDATVILFMGRVNRDKGIVELVSAFRELPGKVELALVGPFEPEHDPLPQDVIDELASNLRIHIVGHTREPERYMGMADILCLPSYREGFGSVIIEAAAMGVPAVATSIVGLVDAVADGETGLLVPPKDAESLRKALIAVILDPESRERMGKAARERAERLFDAAVVNGAVADEYHRLYRRLLGPERVMRRQPE